jgi:dTDP-4-dehydrorhamnose 3,5-epimerase
MKIYSSKFPEIIIIEPDVHLDHRGYFIETYRKDQFQSHGIDIDFIQDNHSSNLNKGTIRGMHFQLHPKAQNKLIRVVAGAIMNVIVDVRLGSPTFKQYETIHLSSDNKKSLLLPVGFANGYCTLMDNTEVIYKVDQYYSLEHDRAFAWDDPDVGIEWNVVNPILSERDKNAPKFCDVEINFKYGA